MGMLGSLAGRQSTHTVYKQPTGGWLFVRTHLNNSTVYTSGSLDTQIIMCQDTN